MKRLLSSIAVAGVIGLVSPALAFIWAWKAGHFHDLERQARIPLGIEEEDYYTPDWAFDDEEWDDVPER